MACATCETSRAVPRTVTATSAGMNGCGDDRGTTVVETSLARVARWEGTRAREGWTVVVVRVASDIARVARRGREAMSVVGRRISPRVSLSLSLSRAPRESPRDDETREGCVMCVITRRSIL